MKDFLKRITVDQNFKAGTTILALLILLGSGYNLYQFRFSGSQAAPAADKCPQELNVICVELSQQCRLDIEDCRDYCTPESGCSSEEWEECVKDTKEKYNGYMQDDRCIQCNIPAC